MEFKVEQGSTLRDEGESRGRYVRSGMYKTFRPVIRSRTAAGKTGSRKTHPRSVKASASTGAVRSGDDDPPEAKRLNWNNDRVGVYPGNAKGLMRFSRFDMPSRGVSCSDVF